MLAAVGLGAGYLRGGRAVRTLLAFAVGLFAIAHGIGVHVAHAAKVELGGADYAGLVALAAGIVLLVLALVLQLAGSYRDRIGPEASLWYVGDAGHTRALAVHPDEYERRVVGFLEASL